MKYVLFLFLCEGGCALNTSGIGHGLVSMSPPRSSKSFRVWVFKYFAVLVMLFLLRGCLYLFILLGGLGGLWVVLFWC
jgi:hypothetical protein